MSRRVVTRTEKVCDYCGDISGSLNLSGDGGMMGFEQTIVERVRIKHLKCGHDICDYCWWYPGDMDHCPKCGPNRIGAIGNLKGKPSKRDYCFKHNNLRQSDGSCPSCRGK